jgi:hypothetical protein
MRANVKKCFRLLPHLFLFAQKKKQTARVCVFVLRARVTERKNTTRRQLFLLLKAKKKAKASQDSKKKKERARQGKKTKRRFEFVCI